MATVDEIEELRAELRYTLLTGPERSDAMARLKQLLETATPKVSPRPSRLRQIDRRAKVDRPPVRKAQPGVLARG